MVKYPYKIEVIMTGLLRLPNFGHISTTTTQFESHKKILLVTSWAETMTPKSLFQNRLKNKIEKNQKN